MASKFKRRLGFGCGIITLLGMGFFAGMIFAVAVAIRLDRVASNWQSEESKNFIINHFQQVLKLTPEQRKQITPIIREGLEERWSLRREYYAETDRLFVEKYVPRISEFLSDEQKARLNKRLANWRHEHKVRANTAGNPEPEPEPEPDEESEAEHSSDSQQQVRLPIEPR